MTTKRKKLNATIESIRDLGTVTGKIGERQKMERADGSPVENKFGTQLETVELIQGDGEIKKYWVDGGLRGAFALAKVKPGMLVEIVHTGEVKHDEYNTILQTYDIFELEA